MTESNTHKFIKEKIAEAFRELGYATEIEKRVKEGRLDVYAEKDGNKVSVEVFKSHIPEWIVTKVHGDIPELEPIYDKINKKKEKYNTIFMKNYLLALIGKDNSITCMLCVRNGNYPHETMYEKDLVSHYAQKHTGADFEKYPDLYIPESK